MFGNNEGKIVKKYSLRQTVKEVLLDINLTSGDDSQEDEIIYENALQKCLPASKTFKKSREISSHYSKLNVSNNSLLASLGYDSPQSTPSKCFKSLPLYSPSAASTSSRSSSFTSPKKRLRTNSLRSSNAPLKSSHCSTLKKSSYSFEHELSPLHSPDVSSINSPSSLSTYPLLSSSSRSCKSLTPSSPLSSIASQNITITSRIKPQVSFATLSPLPSSPLSSLSSSSSSSFKPFASFSFKNSDSKSLLSSSINSPHHNCNFKSHKSPKSNRSLKSLRKKKLRSSSNISIHVSNETKTPRRSSRKRVKPLEFWRGELPIYKPQPDGTYVLDRVVEGSSSPIINKLRKSNTYSRTKTKNCNKTPFRIQTSRRSSSKFNLDYKKDQNISTSSFKKAEASSNKPKSSQDVSSQTLPLEESNEDEISIQTQKTGRLAKTNDKDSFKSTKVTLVDKSTNSEEIFNNNFVSERLNTPRFKDNLNWQVSQTSQSVFLASTENNKDTNRRRGYLKILGKGEKPSQITGNYEMDLMVIDGKVAVTIGDAKAVNFSYPDTFSIPNHTCYSIKNLLETEAFFSFYVFCKT